MNKTHTNMLKENCLPYLKNCTKMVGTQKKLKYTFDITNSSREDRDVFYDLVTDYSCWKYAHDSNHISYVTDSVTLRDLFYDDYAEMADDIPVNKQIFQDTNIPDTILSEFKTQTFRVFNQIKEKEMNDKFKVKYNIEINVNGKDFILTDPIKAEDALPVVLALSKRSKTVKERRDLLTDAGEDTNASVNKLVNVFDNEIDEIKELLDYINDNIEDSD